MDHILPVPLSRHQNGKCKVYKGLLSLTNCKDEHNCNYCRLKWCNSKMYNNLDVLLSFSAVNNGLQSKFQKFNYCSIFSLFNWWISFQYLPLHQTTDKLRLLRNTYFCVFKKKIGKHTYWELCRHLHKTKTCNSVPTLRLVSKVVLYSCDMWSC